MKFIGEVLEVRSLKAKHELDRTFQIKIITDNSEILEIGKLPADTVFEIRVDPLDNKAYGANR
jgi:hypothetical protein